MEKMNKVSQRFKFTRILTGLTVKSFCEKHDLNAGYFVKQESGNRPPTKESVEKILPCFNKEGVICTAEWILEGKGDFPTLTDENYWKKLGEEDN